MSVKSTGITRKVDELGRIVIPKSIRENFDITEKDPIEIFTDNDRIILQKYQPSCVFCGNADNVILFHGKRVCDECIESLKNSF